MSSATLLLLLLAGLQAAQTVSGRLDSLVDEIHRISEEEVAANNTDTLRKRVKRHHHEVEEHLHELEASIQYLRELSSSCCGVASRLSRVGQEDSSRPGEIRRMDCNHHEAEGDDNMMIGLHDDNQFTDLDTAKCIHYDDIHLGKEHDIDVNLYSDELQSCSANQVLTAFGATSVWMEDISRMTCTDITGATVSDHCEDITITADKSGPYLEANVDWPVQCSSAAPFANVMVGVFYNPHKSPRWLGIRCCHLKRTIPHH